DDAHRRRVRTLARLVQRQRAGWRQAGDETHRRTVGGRRGRCGVVEPPERRCCGRCARRARVPVRPAVEEEPGAARRAPARRRLLRRARDERASMKLLRAWILALPAYLWSGWGAIASLLMLVAAWELVAAVYGPLVLPDPRTAFATLYALVASGDAWPELAATARRALAGFALSVLVGSALGLAASVSMTASAMSRPVVTVLMGTPPIAWLVLAMLWFGASDGTPVFTVFVASFPVVFVGALQGARTLDNQLRTMAAAFRL